MLVVQLLAPFLVCLYLSVIESIASSYINSVTNLHPNIVNIDKIEKCEDKDCITLGIALTHGYNDWSTFVINYLEDNYNLKKGKDIKVVSESGRRGLMDYALEHRMGTGVLFCTESLELPPNDFIDVLPCSDLSRVYILMINNTEVSRMGVIDPSAPDLFNYTPISVLIN